jgi:hypothetical protein
MSQVKRHLEEQEARNAEIERIGIEAEALNYDGDADETSSTQDEDASKDALARVFRAWAEGKIQGTADEVFEAAKLVWGGRRIGEAIGRLHQDEGRACDQAMVLQEPINSGF